MKKWSKLLTKARKVESAARASIVRTGGGPGEPLIDNISSRILSSAQANVFLDIGKNMSHQFVLVPMLYKRASFP